MLDSDSQGDIYGSRELVVKDDLQVGEVLSKGMPEWGVRTGIYVL